MLQNNLPLSVNDRAKPAQEAQAPKIEFTSPQLFAVGPTVELIQGAGGYHVDFDRRTWWD